MTNLSKAAKMFMLAVAECEMGRKQYLKDNTGSSYEEHEASLVGAILQADIDAAPTTKLKFKYEASTRTIRTIPENWCVCALKTFSDGGSTDAALGDLDELGERLVKKLNAPLLHSTQAACDILLALLLADDSANQLYTSSLNRRTAKENLDSLRYRIDQSLKDGI